MTDEEMAEKYAKANMHYEVAKREDGTDYAKEVSNVTIKQAFLAGLEAGKDMVESDLATIAYMQGAERYKTKWHDLRKDPNDLPLNTDPVLCLGSTGFIVCKYISESWIDNQTIKLVPKYIDIYKWCEIEDTEE